MTGLVKKIITLLLGLSLSSGNSTPPTPVKQDFFQQTQISKKRVELSDYLETPKEKRLEVNFSKLAEKINNVYLLSSIGDSTPSFSPKYAVKREEQIFLHPVVEIDNQGTTEYYSHTDRIVLGGKIIKTNPSKTTKKNLGILEYQFFKIEPVISIFSPYQNASKITKKWIGWDKIEYRKNKFVNHWGLGPIKADSVPTNGTNYNGLGTMRFSLELNVGSKELSTSNHNDTTKIGISNQVIRINYIKDRSFKGWLTSYFNVPGVYGSASPNGKTSYHQTEDYQGFDCADLMVGAARHLNKKYDYTYADDLRRKIQHSKPHLLQWNGEITDLNNKPVNIEFGKDVNEGDLIFFSEPNKNNAWHVVALYKDLNPASNVNVTDVFKQKQEKEEIKGNGILDPGDLILHYKYVGISVEDLRHIYLIPKTQKIVFGRF